MQRFLLTVASGLTAVAVAISLTAQTTRPPEPPPTPVPGATKSTPAKPADAKSPAKTDAKSANPSATPAKPAPKKAEPEPKIPGTVISRANGTFLGLTLEGGKFKLSFYDAKKKPMAPDVTRANARWPNSKGRGDNRTVLNPGGDGKSLLGSTVVLPPFNFNVFLILIAGEGDQAQVVESFPPFKFGG